LFGVSRRPIFKLLLIKETAMDSGAVSVHFDSGHLFLDLSDGQAVEFPLGWFPALQAATTAERGCFAISLDRQQLYWRNCMKRWTSPLCCSPCQTVRGTRPCLVPLGRSTFFVEHGVTIFALSTCRFVFSAGRCRRSSSASTTLNACWFQCRPRNESYDQDGACYGDSIASRRAWAVSSGC
jgi:hypothetical protein